MKKIYKYENAIIKILNPDDIDLNNLRTATELFIRKVLKEKCNNGNCDSSRDFYKK